MTENDTTASIRQDPTQQTLMELKLDGKVVVRIHTDGTTEFADDLDPNEAARHFWKCVGAVGTDKEKLYFEEMNKAQAELGQIAVEYEKGKQSIGMLEKALEDRVSIVDDLLTRIDILNGNGPQQPRGNRFKKIFLADKSLKDKA